MDSSPVSIKEHLTRKRRLLGRDSPERNQRDIAGLILEWLAGAGSWACWAETAQRNSRERFLVVFGFIEQDQKLNK